MRVGLFFKTNPKMKKYNTVVVSLEEGDTVATADFPTIPGKMLGFGTTLIGNRPGSKGVKVTLKDGGNDMHRPIDINFSETVGRNNLIESLLHLEKENPGRITAQIQVDAPVAAGEEFKVEVLVLSNVKEMC